MGGFASTGSRIKSNVSAMALNIQQEVPLAPFTTFRVGGAAKYFTAVSQEADLLEALRYAKEQGLAVFVLGGGSNILFSDQGFNGLVIRWEDATLELAEDGRVRVGGGARLMDLVLFARDHALSGVEYLAGIPGSVGGAIRGNAGAFGTEIGHVVASVRTLNRETLEIKTFTRDECAFTYRNSIFKADTQWVVLAAEVILQMGEKEEIARIVAETMAKREAKHPQDAQCAGSFFMNPSVTNEALRREFELDSGMPPKDDKLPAGWLIDHAGMRGKRVGDAMVSEIHPNYILNVGQARAEDIMILSSLIKQRVRTHLGVQLREEVQMVGF